MDTSVTQLRPSNTQISSDGRANWLSRTSSAASAFRHPAAERDQESQERLT